MKNKPILTPEHFQNKSIEWWPREVHDVLVGDEYLFSKLKGKESLKIIELGPGRGRLTFPLRDMGHHIHAVEINPGFIKYCKKKNNTKNIHFYHGDVKDLPFGNDIFDLAICVHVLMHLPYPEKTLEELNRVLKDDGKLILMFLRKYSLNYFILTGKILMNRYKHDLDYQFHSWSKINKFLRNANFKTIERYNTRRPGPYIYCKKNNTR